MKKNKIDVHMGTGKLTAAPASSGQVTGEKARSRRSTAKHIIIATGARARDLPKAKADGTARSGPIATR